MKRHKKSSSAVKTASKKASSSKLTQRVKSLYARNVTSARNYKERRPHRSFRRTRRRDYKRSLVMPGYWSFTNSVRAILWENRKIFLVFMIVYGVLTGLFVGLASQDTYQQLSDTLTTTGSNIFDGNFGELSKATLLLTTALTGSLSGNLTDVQRIFASLLALFAWLTTVWLLRSLLAGQRPRFRDGLYNSGSPFIPTLLVSLLLVVQLLPLALALIAYSAAQATGFLDVGYQSIVFWAAAFLLGILSLYWVTSTVLAMVVVTLPGKYPADAIRTAGDLAIGRRFRILLRVAWLALSVVVIWGVIMIPVIVFDAAIKDVFPIITRVPFVPLALAAVGAFTVLWTASYIYLLYRKIVEDDVSPA